MGRGQGNSTHAIALGRTLSLRKARQEAEVDQIRYTVEAYRLVRDGSRQPVDLKTRGGSPEYFEQVNEPMAVELVRQRYNGAQWQTQAVLDDFTESSSHRYSHNFLSHQVVAYQKFAQEMKQRPPGWHAEQCLTDQGQIEQQLIERRLRGSGLDLQLEERVIKRALFDPDEATAIEQATENLADFKVAAAQFNEQVRESAKDHELRLVDTTAKQQRAQELANMIEHSTAGIEAAV